jgi:hypothetical protein
VFAEAGSAVDFDRYSSWARKHPQSTAFLDTFRFISRVELGVRPSDVKEEAAIITAVYKARPR